MNGILTQIRENLSFFLVCVGIVGLAIAAAKLMERRLPSCRKTTPARRIAVVGMFSAIAMVLHILDFPVPFLAPPFYKLRLPSCRKTTPARRIAVVGMFSAIAMVLHILDFPVPFLAPPFYKLDFSEVPVLLCGFLLGPSAGITCLGTKVMLKLLVKGTTTAFVGDLANFVIGCTLVLPAVLFYHARKSKKNAVIGLILGTLTMTVFGSIFNAVYLIPKFSQLYGTPLDAIISMGQVIFPAVQSVLGTLTMTVFGSIFNAVYLIPKFSQLYGTPLDAIISMGQVIFPAVQSVTTLALWCVAPLNLLKGVMVSVLTLLLYKHVEKPLLRSHA